MTKRGLFQECNSKVYKLHTNTNSLKSKIHQIIYRDTFETLWQNQNPFILKTGREFPLRLPTCTHEDEDSIPGLAQRVKDLAFPQAVA